MDFLPTTIHISAICEKLGRIGSRVIAIDRMVVLNEERLPLPEPRESQMLT
jgi:hypothetical protein